MKKLLIVMLSFGLALGVSAQRGFHGGGTFYRPHIVVGGGFYSPFYPFGYGYGYGYAHRPSKLDMKIEDIKNDYKDRIWSVKHDKTLTGKERRHQVRMLKQERDKDVYDAKSNYYKNY